ncbi:MAG: hypothetical protein ICV60_23550 [Pyrinomonadaceae bacterium]|nr:hypothetical protein [Pyrinomonadaceae bacterium]
MRHGEESNPLSELKALRLEIVTCSVVRWVNLTENYWVRARPDQFIEAAKALG